MDQTRTQSPPPPPPIRPMKTKTRQAQEPPATNRPAKAPHTKKHSGRKPPHRRNKVRKEISAGGVVVRQERGAWQVALLKTEHKRGLVWVLPKGHVELHKGEKVSDAARREVEEESGITDLSVKDQLGVTRFTFQAEETIIRKTVHYFLMETSQKKLIPQEEEFMYDAAWYPIDVAISTLEYDTDKDIVAKARQKLTGQPIPASLRNKKRPQAAKRHSRSSGPRIRV